MRRSLGVHEEPEGKLFINSATFRPGMLFIFNNVIIKNANTISTIPLVNATPTEARGLLASALGAETILIVVCRFFTGELGFFTLCTVLFGQKDFLGSFLCTDRRRGGLEDNGGFLVPMSPRIGMSMIRGVSKPLRFLLLPEEFAATCALMTPS